MAGYIKTVSVLFLVLSVVFKESAGSTSACYHQVGSECPDKPVAFWKEERCDFHSLTDKLLDVLNLRPANMKLLNYACVKLSASNSDTNGCTEVYRGCTTVLPESEEITCGLFVAGAKQEGMKNVRCHICYGDLCNGALGLTTAPAAFILLAVASIKAMLY